MQSLERDHFLDQEELFDGRYRLERLIGQGGMGRVYLAEDTMFDGEKIALKILHSDLCADEKHIKRFLREVQLTRRVTHTNVVRTFDAGSVSHQLYFTMEYAQGDTLKERLNTSENDRIDPYEAVKFIDGVCQGLSAIHAAEIIHRDLKPGNVIISKEGLVKITDFGVARPGSSDITGLNEVVGSVPYMAPEVWAGKPIDALTDIYALGVLTYEIITGELPFDGDSPAEVMRKHLESDPVPPSVLVPNLPLWLDSLILKMLAGDSSQRPQSADEVSRIIQEKISRRSEIGGDVESPQPSRPTPRNEASSFLGKVSKSRTDIKRIQAPKPQLDLLIDEEDKDLFDSVRYQRSSSLPVRRKTKQASSMTSALEPLPQLSGVATINRLLRVAIPLLVSALVAALVLGPLGRFSRGLWTSLGSESELIEIALSLFLPVVMYAAFLSIPAYVVSGFTCSPRRSLRVWLSMGIGCTILWSALFTFTCVRFGFDKTNVQEAPTNFRNVRNILEASLTNMVEVSFFMPQGSVYEIVPVTSSSSTAPKAHGGGVELAFLKQASPTHVQCIPYYVLLVAYLGLLVSVIRRDIARAHNLGFWGPYSCVLGIAVLLCFAEAGVRDYAASTFPYAFFQAQSMVFGPFMHTMSGMTIAFALLNWMVLSALGRKFFKNSSRR